jgi:hypothetical protein
MPVWAGFLSLQHHLTENQVQAGFGYLRLLGSDHGRREILSCTLLDKAAAASNEIWLHCDAFSCACLKR